MTITRSRAWKLVAPANLALLAFVLFFAGLRLARPGTVFYYTEGPVLGSLAALEETGHVSGLYPADGWTEPPVVLTLYPPTYFLAAAGVDRWLGSEGSFLGLRLVSVLALVGVLGLLAWLALRHRAPGAWILALLAAAMVTPGLYRVVGGAQADVLALFCTWVGLAAMLDPREGRLRRGAVPLVLAAGAFLVAFLVKQSFVAAPAAVALALALDRRTLAGAAFGLSLVVAALGAMFLLDGLTGGGYFANTLGALTGDSSFANLQATMIESAPLQWLPLVAVVLFAVRRDLRAGLPELYLVASAGLHVAAMVKTGSSVNYLLEPTFALVLLAVVRCPQRARSEPAGESQSPAAGPSWIPAVLALALLLPAAVGGWRELPPMRAWMSSAGSARVAEFEGHPLVDPLFFPAVMARGGRPWLNDPFAFGALEESGQWDPGRLVEDLEARRIPFALTTVDPGHGPAPPGAGSRELVMAYFWRSRPVWEALNAGYEPTAAGPVTAWLPRESEER